MMPKLITCSVFASSAVNVDIDLTTVAHLVLFTAFVLIMKQLLFDPLLRVFEERERRTAGAIEKAREMDEQAIALKRKHDQKMEEIRREAAHERERMRRETLTLQSEMQEAARAAAHGTLEKGLARIDAEVGRSRAALEAQREALAAEIASKVLGRAVLGREGR